MSRWGIEPVSIDRSDTLQSALGKLATAKGSTPIVVLDSGCRVADSVVLYRLLARKSREFGLPIAVITSNPSWRRLAREHGLYAFASLGALKRARSRSPVAWLENLADSLVFSWRPALSVQGWVILGILSLVLGLLIYLFVPLLTVTVQMPVETFDREFVVHVDAGLASVDASSATIPGRTIDHRFAVSDFVDTTGEKSVGKSVAKGEVTVINGNPAVVMLPAGTILSTASGLRFRTTAPANLSAFAQPTIGPQPLDGAQPATSVPGVVKVPVEATDPGAAGNVPALAIGRVEGDQYRGVTVFNEQPLSGGSDTKARTASADDRSRLKEALFQKAQSQSLSELTVRVRQSESLIPHSMQVRIESEEYDRAVGDEGERLNGTMYVVASGIAFANQELNGVVEQEWRKSVPKGYRPLPSLPELSPPEIVEAGARTATLRVRLKGKAEPMVEVERLAETLRGLSVQDARSKLAAEGGAVKLVKLEIWPGWADRAMRVEVRTIR